MNMVFVLASFLLITTAHAADEAYQSKGKASSKMYSIPDTVYDKYGEVDPDLFEGFTYDKTEDLESKNIPITSPPISSASSEIILKTCHQNESLFQDLTWSFRPKVLEAGQRIFFNVTGNSKAPVTSGRVKGTIYFDHFPIWKVDEDLCTFSHHYLYLDCPFKSGPFHRSGFYDPPPFLPTFGTASGSFSAYDEQGQLVVCLIGSVIFY